MTFEEAKEYKAKYSEPVEKGLKLFVVPNDPEDYSNYLEYVILNGKTSELIVKMFSRNNDYTIAKMGDMGAFFIHEKL